MVKRRVDREKTESGIGGNAIACQERLKSGRQLHFFPTTYYSAILQYDGHNCKYLCSY